jgi:hypothetical protein
MPEVYIMGKISITLMSSSSSWDVSRSDGIKSNIQYKKEVYEVLIPIQVPIYEASATPTFTPTNTSPPTATFTPTPTYTPLPSFYAQLLGYGTYGGGVDFIKFEISPRPETGTFLAVVNGKDYTCDFSTLKDYTLVCQGPAFPSGVYVDVVLYYEGTQIFSGQIFRAIIPPEEEKEKPTSTPKCAEC